MLIFTIIETQGVNETTISCVSRRSDVQVTDTLKGWNVVIQYRYRDCGFLRWW